MSCSDDYLDPSEEAAREVSNREARDEERWESYKSERNEYPKEGGRG